PSRTYLHGRGTIICRRLAREALDSELAAPGLCCFRSSHHDLLVLQPVDGTRRGDRREPLKNPSVLRARRGGRPRRQILAALASGIPGSHDRLHAAFVARISGWPIRLSHGFRPDDRRGQGHGRSQHVCRQHSLYFAIHHAILEDTGAADKTEWWSLATYHSPLIAH